MRIHPDIVQIPSSRQVLSIPKLIVSRYYRKGSVTPNDFIEISAVTSFPDNQNLAKEIAFEVLFPNYNKNIMDSFFLNNEITWITNWIWHKWLGRRNGNNTQEMRELIDDDYCICAYCKYVEKN